MRPNGLNGAHAELTVAIGSEMDQEKRLQMMKEAWAIYEKDRPYLPLFQVKVVWGVAKNVDVLPDPLNRVYLPDVTLN